MGEIYIKSFLPFDRKLILVSDQLFLYKSRPNFPSIFTAMHLLINSIDTERDTSDKMFHSLCKIIGNELKLVPCILLCAAVAMLSSLRSLFMMGCSREERRESSNKFLKTPKNNNNLNPYYINLSRYSPAIHLVFMNNNQEHQ